MRTREELFNEQRKKAALRAAQILNALKYRGMKGMKAKIVDLLTNPHHERE